MDINLTQIAQLIAIAEQANIDELEINEGHCSIRITCRSHHHSNSHSKHHNHILGDSSHGYHNAKQHHTDQPSEPMISPVLFTKSNKPIDTLSTDSRSITNNSQTSTTSTSQASSSSQVTSPMVGTFYRKSSPDVPSFVEVGQNVAIGDTLCIIEAMKIMHEVKAEQAGVVREILVNDGEMVEYAQPLFTIE